MGHVEVGVAVKENRKCMLWLNESESKIRKKSYQETKTVHTVVKRLGHKTKERVNHELGWLENEYKF